MDDHGKTVNSIAARLRNHIAPELGARLAAEGALPPEIMRAECARLRADLAAIATYIPALVVREQLQRPEPGRVSGAYWDGSILFADLSGFTALSGKLSARGKQGAEEISLIINNLFSALVEEIYRYHGVLLKFGGDALTAFFDAATLGDMHASVASRAALALQERMAGFAALETRAGTFRLRLRIGVHSGRVFAAQVGDTAHIEVIVTGHDINRVALAQEIAEPGDVIVSEATLGRLAAAAAEQRQSGFHLLRSMPEVAPIHLSPQPLPAAGAGDLDELLRLAGQIDALRPYLPHKLPRRFIETSIESTESGEFRPVTVLFANFFLFSAILDLLGDDCVTAARVLNAYYCRAQQVVHRYGGIINKVDMYTYGDKLMALFGAPVAHEDDPQRAVRAAFELRAMLMAANEEIAALMEEASAPPSVASRLNQRIGINTGVVFAGQVGAARRREYTVMGQPVNLAARLMAASDAGAIILSPGTRRLVERHTALRTLPPVKLKGVAGPVSPAEALYLVEFAQAPQQTLKRPELVGREHELARMIAEARAALGGSGRVLALTGEAGTGKTRLIEDALQQLIMLSGTQEGDVPAFFPYRVECQSYEQTAPYAVVRELLRQFFNLSLSGAAARQEALPIQRRVAELTPDMARFTPLLNDLMGLPIDDTPLTAALTPEQRHSRAQELVEALLLAEAREQPLVVIIDDLHWIDASSLEVLARLTQAIAGAPILVMLGYRTDPAIAEPWSGLAHCRRMLIRELPPEGSAALVRALLQGDPPPDLAGLLEKTQGNPFFVEEVIRELVETGALQMTAGGWRLMRALDEIAIPDSVEGVITARLDRLEERSREVLQTASVIGRRFPYILLSGVVLQRDDLVNRLVQLSEAELILREELERDLAYLFKHALTRDVAYEAILYARRRELHRRVGQQIEQIYTDRLDEQLPLLARHYLLAEDWEPAFEYHLRAGRKAQARFANREAIALFERALQILPRIEPAIKSAESPAARSARRALLDSASVEIHERLGAVHALIGEYETALARYATALELLRRQPDAPVGDTVRLYHHIARVYEKRAEFDTAFAWVERALTFAGALPNREIVRCLLLGAGLHRRRGRYGQALEWGEQARQLAEQQGSIREQAHAFKLLGGAHYNLGDNLRALDLISRSLALYEQANDLDGLSYAHNDLAVIYDELGRLTDARRHYEAGAAIKQAIGDIYGQAMIANNLGELFRLQGDLDAAIAHYSSSLAIFERIGSPYMTGLLHMNLGAAYLLHGDLDTAERHLRQSTELFDQAGAEDFLPELERYLAELRMRRGDLAEARLACELSLATAARLEARAEEGAARRSLGQILARSGDAEGAWEELQQSLAILREASSRHEIARTLLAIADLAPPLGRQAEGLAALGEALPILRSIGAQLDLNQAYAIAGRHNYDLSAAESVPDTDLRASTAGH